ncbi:hypothetical protein PHPALM_29174 [Phytophthora palmivora]|uniref:Uncharacterized protein n=1 Tax=Phytophthora palmivora TaxID=4796 RepID=A0A2P4X8A9_9STRA|nr:hypothetical protein PHPALM_29174 [Phytophthora palmivora]
MPLPDKQVPSLSRVLEWARHTTDRFHVSELLNNYLVIMEDDFMSSRTARCERGYVFTDDYDYNYVIPKSLVTKLEAVLEAEKMKRSDSKYFGNVSKADHFEGTTETLLTFFPGGSPKFTSGAVYRMKAFYSLQKDMDWILSTKWDTLLATLELFDEETDSDELLPSTAGVKHKELNTEVAIILGGVNLGSIFRLTT